MISAIHVRQNNFIKILSNPWGSYKHSKVGKKALLITGWPLTLYMARRFVKIMLFWRRGLPGVISFPTRFYTAIIVFDYIDLWPPKWPQRDQFPDLKPLQFNFWLKTCLTAAQDRKGLTHSSSIVACNIRLSFLLSSLHISMLQAP
jgi:hypothetical protein